MADAADGKPNGSHNGNGKKQRAWTMIIAGLTGVVLAAQAIGAGNIVEPYWPSSRGYVREHTAALRIEIREERGHMIGEIAMTLKNLNELQLDEKAARLKSEIVSLEATAAQMRELLSNSPDNASDLRRVLKDLEQQVDDSRASRSSVLCQIDVLNGVNRAC